MRLETFQHRLQSGKGVTYLYRLPDRHGGINIWKYEAVFVLTWEEGLLGDEFNESNYTRDEVHHFEDVDSVIAFLQSRDIDPEAFTP